MMGVTETLVHHAPLSIRLMLDMILCRAMPRTWASMVSVWALMTVVTRSAEVTNRVESQLKQASRSTETDLTDSVVQHRSLRFRWLLAL